MPKKRAHNFKDITGQKFGRLTVLSEAGKNKHNQALWFCRCACGTEKIVSGNNLSLGNTKSCGCLNKEINSKPLSKKTRKKMSKAKEGKNNPAWKNGITPECKLIRKSPEYKLWRTSVFKRDIYTCQICGDDKGGNLQAHHLFPFSKYKILWFEVYNGQTLCRKCHSKLRGKELYHRIQIVQQIFNPNKLKEAA